MFQVISTARLQNLARWALASARTLSPSRCSCRHFANSPKRLDAKRPKKLKEEVAQEISSGLDLTKILKEDAGNAAQDVCEHLASLLTVTIKTFFEICLHNFVLCHGIQ
jgi:hypothetical protein